MWLHSSAFLFILFQAQKCIASKQDSAPLHLQPLLWAHLIILFFQDTSNSHLSKHKFSPFSHMASQFLRQWQYLIIDSCRKLLLLYHFLSFFFVHVCKQHSSGWQRIPLQFSCNDLAIANVDRHDTYSVMIVVAEYFQWFSQDRRMVWIEVSLFVIVIFLIDLFACISWPPEIFFTEVNSDCCDRLLS